MKKYILSVMLLLSVLVLTGCGASVTSKTNFNQAGGGTRAISAVISAGDAKNLTNGFDELDVLLKQAAPEGVTINRTTLDNGDAKYQFSIQFSDIDDYNRKVSAITGKSHKATWYNGTNAFQSDVEFSEEDCTYDLIAWAIKAFKDSKYSAFSSYFTLYDVDRNEFYFDDQLVYSGSGNPSFKVETSPKLVKTSMYTDFTYGTATKRLELNFADGSLEYIDSQAARRLLETYSNKVKIDTANSVIVFELDSQEEIVNFLKKADSRNGDASIQYVFVNNPFQKKYELKEQYFLSDLLNNFSVNDGLIYEYIQLPEMTEDATFTQSGQAVEVPGKYNYATVISKEEGYSMEAKNNHMVDLKDINITYDVTSDLNCKRSVEVSYIKNDCAITENQLSTYFPNVKEKISFFDAGDTIRLVFVSQQKKNDSLVNGFGFEKLGRKNLKFINHALEDKLDLSRYLPILEGYQWNMDNIRYNYLVNVEEKAGLYSATVGQQAYQEADQSLTQVNDVRKYTLQGSDTADHNFILRLDFRQMYHLFYFWIILIIFFIVVAVLAFILYYTKKKLPIKNDSLDE